ncbi:MAG: hypothetical protein QXI33_02775 [Candidatus Pacearchaeota archaeon]
MVYYLPWSVSLENLALIVICLSLIKVLVILIKPDKWVELIALIYRIPTITIFVSLVLGYIVLGNLIASGITYVEIMAVALLIFLLMLLSFSLYSKEMPLFGKKLLQDKSFWKKAWLPTLIWVILSILALNEIFMFF